MDKEVKDIIDSFFIKYPVRNYKTGQILLLKGDEARSVYYLTEGRVKQYDVTNRGDEIILNTFKPPAFFPMSLAINAGKSSYIYAAETAIEVRQAPVEETIVFIKRNPTVIFDLLSRVYRGIDGMTDRMRLLMASSAKSRLMLEILIECRRFGKISSKGSCEININEVKIASRAGLTRETVSREIRKLIAEGKLSLDKSKLVIKNCKDFEDYLRKTI